MSSSSVRTIANLLQIDRRRANGIGTGFLDCKFRWQRELYTWTLTIAQNRLYLGCIARTLVRDWQREVVINPNVFARRAALFDFVVEYKGRKLHTAGKVCCLRSLCRTHGQSGQTVFGLLLRSMTGCAVAPTATGLVNGKGQNSTPPPQNP